MLVRYKEELSRPFDEAASFLSSIQTQLSNLCSGATSPPATTATHSGNQHIYSLHLHAYMAVVVLRFLFSFLFFFWVYIALCVC